MVTAFRGNGGGLGYDPSGVGGEGCIIGVICVRSVLLSKFAPLSECLGLVASNVFITKYVFQACNR